MKRNNLKLFGLFIVVSILSMWAVSAYSLTINSNETNGTTWYKGGIIRTFNFTIITSGMNSSENLTQINFSMANMTLVSLNYTNTTAPTQFTNTWSCTNASTNLNLVNCTAGTVATGGAGGPGITGFAIMLSITATFPTTATQINQTWNITTLDNNTVFTNSSWNTEVDSVPPVITLPAYTNATARNSASTLALNVLVSDIGSGGSACMINTNGGTNQTVAVSSGWCNGTLGLTGLANGANVINIYANDSVNNMGLNNSFIVLMDSNTPVISALCTPSAVSPSGTVTCTCTGAAISSILSSTPTSTIIAGGPGIYSYLCTITSNAGNTATTTATYSVGGYPGPGYIPHPSSVTPTAPSTITGNIIVNNTNQTTPVSPPLNNQPPQSSNWLVNLWNSIVSWFSHLF